MSPDLKTSLPESSAAHSRICRQSSAEDSARFEQIKYFRQIPKGQKIAAAGVNMDFLAIIQSGAVVVTREGRLSGLLVAGDFIGMAGRTDSRHDLFAVSDCLLKCFRRQPFESLLAQSPALSGRLQDFATDELVAEREWSTLDKEPRARVAGVLAMLFGRLIRSGHGEGAILSLPDVAVDLLAVGREVFDAHLADLVTAGAILRTEDGIVLRDAALLRA